MDPLLHRSSDRTGAHYDHDVSEQEVEAVLDRPMQDIRGRDDSRIAIGQSEEGRYLKVIYVPDPIPGLSFCDHSL